MTDFNFGPSVEERLARIEVTSEGQSKKLDRILSLLDGPTGMVVRLDRGEQQLKNLRHYGHVLAGCLIAALSSKWIQRLFT